MNKFYNVWTRVWDFAWLDVEHKIDEQVQVQGDEMSEHMARVWDRVGANATVNILDQVWNNTHE